MDTRDGRIYDSEQVKQMKEKHRRYMMEIDPSYRQSKRGKVGRNDPCPCKSGKKFKKCCLLKV